MTRLWGLELRQSLAYEKKEIISVLNFLNDIANGLKTESRLKHHN